MPLPSNGFPTLPTDQTATAKIRSVYRYVQYALLLSRTLLEVLGCSYYLLGCDFNDSASRSTWENIFRTVIVKKKHTVHILEVCVAKQVNGLTRRAQARGDTFGYQRYRACNLWVSSAFKIDDGQSGCSLFGSLYKIFTVCQMRCIKSTSPTGLC